MFIFHNKWKNEKIGIQSNYKLIFIKFIFSENYYQLQQINMWHRDNKMNELQIFLKTIDSFKNKCGNFFRKKILCLLF